MAKDDFYFENFVECAKLSMQTAQKMRDILKESGVDLGTEQVKEIHEIEHNADIKRHELVAHITKDFVTPIEREDIVKLSCGLDDITDSIEDIVIHIYLNNERVLRKDCIEFINLLIRLCQQVEELMIELPNFRKSKKLQPMVAEIHRTEEEADELYIKSMKTLNLEVTDALKIIAWKEIYGLLENSCDTCADVADIVEGIAIANL